MNDNTAWFEKSRPEVADFEFTDCPHGQVVTVGVLHDEWACVRCGQRFVPQNLEEDE